MQPAGTSRQTVRTSPPPVGILLLNLGGPDRLDSVEPFLFRLFSDREIIQLPGGPALQPAFARLIARIRGPKVRDNYRSIGGGSPILPLTRRQAAGLESILNGRRGGGDPGSGVRYKVGIAMRYWRPSTEEALQDMQEAGVRRLVALTLYPQFSAATTQSSLNELDRVGRRLGLDWKITAIDRYPENPGYLDAVAATVLESLEAYPRAQRDRVLLLFSAHGLPMKFIRNGDPYVKEIQKTREGVLERLRGKGVNNPWRFGYQSRTGPVKWIGPYTDAVIEDLAREGVKSILVIPIAFVSDHIETLYEIDQLFGDLARHKGVADFRRTRMLNDDPRFLQALAEMVERHLEETGP